MKGLDNGARMYAVDPRRTSSAKFADVWVGLELGSDVALANTIGREIIDAGIFDKGFIEHSTTGFDAYKDAVDSYTLEHGEQLTGIPAAVIREMAHAYANAEKAQILWTLGITEHHNAVDNVLALCNLSLLTGHIGKWGSGLVPLRGQNNVQGGGDMGSLPNKLPGFQDITDADSLAKFADSYGVELNPVPGKHLTHMFEAMVTGEISCAYVIGENPADSEANVDHARHLLSGLDCLIVQDIFLTRTAELADVVFPASIAWAESDGTVTSSERRVQVCHKAVNAPEGCRDDIDILGELARRLGYEWGSPTPHELWDELRSLSPLHAGMSYERLEQHGGLQWPCPSLDHPGSPFLHGWLWEDDLGGRPPAPFSVVEAQGPIEELSEEFPLRLTTGRALDSYNTGVQSGGFNSPIRYGDELDVHPADALRLGIVDGEMVRVHSPRGSVEMGVRVQSGLVEGLTFTTFHFPDLVDLNVITNDAYDERSGTAEFKAAAIRIEKLGSPSSTKDTEKLGSPSSTNDTEKLDG